MKNLRKNSIIGLSLVALATNLQAGPFQQSPSSKYSSYGKPSKTIYKEKGEKIKKNELNKNIVYVKRDNYISFTTSKNSSETGYIFSKQPIGELVGENGTHNELRYGILVKDENTKRQIGRVYGYLWNNSDKNNEVGIGIGGDIMVQPFKKNSNLNLYIGGQVGFGIQKVNGNRSKISTSLNKVSFITDKGVLTPTGITYKDDTYVLDIGLSLGTNYKLTNNLSLDLGYTYRYSQYQVCYITDQNTNVLNNMSFNQNNHNFKLGLNYKF